MIVKQIVIHDRGAIEMPPPPAPATPAEETPAANSQPEAPKPMKAALAILPPDAKKTDS